MIKHLADVFQDSFGLTNQPRQSIETKETRLLLVESLIEVDEEILNEVFVFLNNKYQLAANLEVELLNRFYKASKKL